MSSLAALLGAIVMGPATAQETKPPAIAVTATGSVDLSPDYAIIRVGVITRDPQAGRAGEQNARITTAVRAALRQLLRVPDDSLPSAGYSVVTDYDRDRRPSGYAARSVIEARVHDLTQAGPVVDAALAAGATQIAGIQFESTRRDAARLEALGRAVEMARREAEAMARAAGGRLGMLVEASSTGPAYPVDRTSRAMSMAMAAEAPTPIAPPELTVQATITARWVFIPQ
ncbi:MAG: SIMPL domain-containing protein [Gemmatimonadetes bacterium]|nr:SIMPL domain-containing protein [Gemmatimonadota bacterium]